jgi:hypothetical protein
VDALTTVGICRRGLANLEHRNVNAKAKNSKVKGMRHVAKSTENQKCTNRLEPDVRVGLFITEDQESYYNTVIALNYLSH